ncbi:hypothetical protein SAMN04488107_2586 [Geodermatophilus saharensis]|uniref:Uncharacterized protein n=1 Tax=Geodermatophilus saharensis TaxID=1137994 RepID=A0A239EII9_9ACTN|nr:hypothetical protein [Geodermatophilus saharensis]SNS44466.1 hypothetical protein SAMN04488107_2586 [Geodermatophilus saharensis]
MIPRRLVLPGSLAAALLLPACATAGTGAGTGTATPAGPVTVAAAGVPDRPAGALPAPLTEVLGFADLGPDAGPAGAAVALAADGGNGVLVWLDRDPSDAAAGSVLVDVGPVTADGGGEGSPVTPEPVSSVAVPAVSELVDLQATADGVLVVGELTWPDGTAGWGLLRVDGSGRADTVAVDSPELVGSRTRATVLTEGGDTLVLALGAAAPAPHLVAVDAADGGVRATTGLAVPGATTALPQDVAVAPDGDLVVALDADVDVRGARPRAVLTTVDAASAEAPGEPFDLGSGEGASGVGEVAVGGDGTAWVTVAGWDPADPADVTWRLVGVAGDVLQEIDLPADAVPGGDLAVDPAGATAYLPGSVAGVPHLFVVDLAAGTTEPVRLAAAGHTADVAVASDGATVWVSGTDGAGRPGVWLVG